MLKDKLNIDNINFTEICKNIIHPINLFAIILTTFMWYGLLLSGYYNNNYDMASSIYFNLVLISTTIFAINFIKENYKLARMSLISVMLSLFATPCLKSALALAHHAGFFLCPISLFVFFFLIGKTFSNLTHSIK